MAKSLVFAVNAPSFSRIQIWVTLFQQTPESTVEQGLQHVTKLTVDRTHELQRRGRVAARVDLLNTSGINVHWPCIRWIHQVR